MPRTRKVPERVDIEPLVENAMKDDAVLAGYVEQIVDSSRHKRQVASTVVYEVACLDLDKVECHAKEILDGLNRPEGQTRCEVLKTLTLFVDKHAKEAMKSIEAAETALFDENSGPLRLSAYEYLCKLGATSEARSREIWPLIDEATQCFHGDVEFNDMLIALLAFSDGKIDPEVAKELAELMKFDSENATGNLKAKSTEIIANCKKKTKKKSEK
ncbi:MAG: hypothetical protein Q3982_01210 [Phoenicibacter congonensis]|uniref:HEAT repeat domain-containing protein n=1 Tax=Phoenicibacter congonensis TaxID=1944646 RepID=A0AA43RGA0_9ACTN|nr:hypothetical protein [Phoenicibacter congonensis]